MKYYLPPSALGDTFAVPRALVNRYYKLANERQLKVLLSGLCNLEWDFSAEKIAEELSLSPDEVTEALEFWADTGLLSRAEAAPEKPATAVTGNVIKPSRAEVARRGLENGEIASLLAEAQKAFGRALRQNESSTLVWLYDDNGISYPVLLTLLNYAKANGTLNIGYIEKTAIRWANNGVVTPADVEEEIRRENERKGAYGLVASAMNLHAPRPTKELTECADLWVNQWGLNKEQLAAAYDECVNRTGRFDLKYIKKVLATAHEGGSAPAKPGKQAPLAAYDKSPELFIDEE